MGLASDMRERIQLERLVEDANGVTKTWTPLATVWAAMESVGSEEFRFRLRPLSGLASSKDAEPAMRIVWLNHILDVEDVTESVRRAEITITARGRQIEGESLAGGIRRKTSWP